MKTELEKQLDALAQKAFEEHNWDFTPLFPNVLIRVFDFEEATSGLIIKPQTAQAPNLHAIVVRTWSPKKVYYKGDTKIVVSELQAGDLVRIPYYAGIPTFITSLDDAGYRIVPENKTFNYHTGVVMSLGATQETPHIFFKEGMFDKSLAVAEILELGDGNGSDDKTIDFVLDTYDIIPKRLSDA